MENTISQMKRPCVLDLKMGTRTWNEEYPEKKILHKKAIDEKSTTPMYGFRFCGMKVSVDNHLKNMQYTKACFDFENTFDNVKLFINEFLNPLIVLEENGNEGKNIVCSNAEKIIGQMKLNFENEKKNELKNKMIEKLIQKLMKFKDVYDECGYQLISSSLFFFYDKENPLDTIDFKMIDFAHWKDKEHRSEISDGFSVGTQSIITLLSQLIK